MLRTIDQLAELSQETAVRRRYDLRNVVVARWLFLFFSITLLSMTGVYAAPRSGIALITGFSTAVNVGLFLIFRRIEPRQTEVKEDLLDRLAGKVEPYARPVILTYLPFQYIVMIIATFGSDNVIPWFMMFPIMILFFRLSASELVMLHGFFVGIVLIERWLFWALLSPDQGLAEVFFPIFLPSLSINAIALGVELYLTRRFRREFLREWSAARESYQERARMRQELEFAREIQLSMLPLESPDVSWLDISSVSLPATEVGGDYYDFFEIDDDRMAVVIGDVAGHGLASGIVLSGVRSCLTLLADELRDPVSVIRRIHEMIRKTARHRMLVTLSIVLLDRSANRAIMTSAGHPPALVRRGNGRVEEIGISALPLGAAMLEKFETRTFTLEPGDVILLQTDGVYEMRDEDGDLFGIERLIERLGAHDPARGSQSLRDAVIRDLWEFRGHAAQEDDLTIVTLTRLYERNAQGAGAGGQSDVSG